MQFNNPASTKNENKKYDNSTLKKIDWPVGFATGFLLIPLALAVSLAITARANGPRDLILQVARSQGNAAVQQPASPLIKAVPTHPLWSEGTIIYDNGGPNQQGGNEMTEWIQAEDFNLSADSTLMIVNFWDIEAPGGAASRRDRLDPLRRRGRDAWRRLRERSGGEEMLLEPLYRAACWASSMNTATASTFHPGSR